MRYRSTVRLARLLPLAFVVALGAAACAHPDPTVTPPTAVASAADVATKLQASANVILHAADAAGKTANPLANGTPLLSTRQVDLVAVDVYKLGKAGKRLKAGFDDYNAIKQAGGDLSAQRVAIQQAIADAVEALHDVSLAVPSGTVAAIDQGVADALAVIAAIKAGAL